MAYYLFLVEVMVWKIFPINFYLSAIDDLCKILYLRLIILPVGAFLCCFGTGRFHWKK